MRALDAVASGPADSVTSAPLPPNSGQTYPTRYFGIYLAYYAVVLLFRGSWCPYCNAQLRAFQRAQDALAEVGVRVVALIYAATFFAAGPLAALLSGEGRAAFFASPFRWVPSAVGIVTALAVAAASVDSA